MNFDAWSESWHGLESDRNAFDTVEWLDSVEEYARLLLMIEGSGRLALEHYVVPVVLLAGSAALDQESVRILDFGGGLGVNYINLRAALPKQLLWRYDIVDSSANGDRFSAIFGRLDNCRFLTEIDEGERYDIVFASSTLQYIPEWKQVLSRLGGLATRWLVLPRLPVTTGQTFAARQYINFVNGPHSGKSAGTMPHWFFNREELRDVLGDQGFIHFHDHFISDYGAEMTHLGHPPGDVTLRVQSFGRPARHPAVN